MRQVREESVDWYPDLIVMPGIMKSLETVDHALDRD